MYKSGIIIKVEKKVAVVFNEFAEYEKVKRIPGMFEGQLIQYNVTKSNLIYKRLAVFSSAAAIFVFVFVAIFVFSKVSKPQVFAFVDLDVNPSIEFSIDEKSKVVSIKSINDDAKEIVHNLDIKGMNINDAVSDTIEKIEERGFVNSKMENVLLISASTNSDSNSDSDLSLTEFKESSKKLKITMDSLRNSIMSKKEKKYTVKLVSVSYEERQNSLANNMSMGRYLIYSQVLKSGRNISTQDAKIVALGELVSYLPKDFGTKDIDFMVQDRIILQNDDKLANDRDKIENESLDENNLKKVPASKYDIDNARNKDVGGNEKSTEAISNTKNSTIISVNDKKVRRHNDLEGYKNIDSRNTPLPSGFDEQFDEKCVTPSAVYTPIPYATPVPVRPSESQEYAPLNTPDSSVIKKSNDNQYVSSTNNGNNTLNTGVNNSLNTPLNTPVNNLINTPTLAPIFVPTPPINRGPHHRDDDDDDDDNDFDDSRDRGQEIPRQGMQKPDMQKPDMQKPDTQKPDTPANEMPKQGFQRPGIPPFQEIPKQGLQKPGMPIQVLPRPEIPKY